ncbi:fructose-1,6-bisphosphatase [Carnobacterium maltaromaticum]|uniref:fructose-1,6-bisphosphatase n=1 Tax=Carnobacterium maltaromaticum TaxID=2751 RepID=UPI00295E3976|nr:fructose-1,6-bisphosphatase [Carnobacterium maltaromaticum]
MNDQQKYLKLLAKQFPTIEQTASEIINLEAILNLPKGTEHFISDVHGEYDAFQHVLRNGSGNVKQKIKVLFKGTLNQQEMKQLATLIYYPEEKTARTISQLQSKAEIELWYQKTLIQLIELCEFVASKYTRSKVRKAMPQEFSYIIEELLFKSSTISDKEDYYQEIIATIILLEQGTEFIAAMSYLIQRLVVDHLHVVGDIYDRGPFPDKIIDTLMNYHSVDIQWGNHDILWMGAASGSAVSLANVIRICARYDNLAILEEGYGISLRPLLTFSDMTYADDSNNWFKPKMNMKNQEYSAEEIRQITKMHQAIAIIQFKLEGAIIERHPEFDMDSRLVLSRIDYSAGTINLNGRKYPLKHHYFPTINPKNPYQLTCEEEKLIQKLVTAFKSSERLQKHIAFLFQKGNMYLTYNNNLLLHGCLPLNPDGSFMQMQISGNSYSGKGLLDQFERELRLAYHKKDGTKEVHLDMLWYLWTGAVSPLFGKNQMTTFERYFVEDEETHIEKKNAYYHLRNNSEICKNILREFEVDPEIGHIINGHTPVKEKIGESPIKADGKLIVIDGGFSKAYQKTTGLAGYTLLYNSYGMELASHQPYSSKKEAIENEQDIVSTIRVIDRELKRKKVRETDNGKELKKQLIDLKALLNAYRAGEIFEER